MSSPATALAAFHPQLAGWFRSEVGEPTDVQARAWPRIAAGEHVLVSAPTGTGKTLTAFLWAIDRLITGAWPTGRLSVLYVSPLRALNTDIRRNLLEPLRQLQARFAVAGLDAPQIRVLTRSGDTPQSERRQMLRRPPEILITTPESLNLLLSSRSGVDLLTGLRCVILDEIHALVDSKRGTHLITAVERLVRGSGEFQRIALSATVHPTEVVSRFIGGYRHSGPPTTPQFDPRPVAVVESEANKHYRIEVCFPEPLDDESTRDEAWAPLTEELRERLHRNRSTLVFVDSRRMAEKITRLVNLAEGELVAYAHHGSLSREIRADVETRLKAGELRAIVATSSLEMGIDIGAIDEVVQILPPPTIAAAIQRAGRAGHQVGQTSHTSLYGAHALHLVEMAVIARQIDTHDLEPVTPIRAPVDVLAQVLISMVALEARDIDELYAELRASTPYHDLSRRQFDLVVEMLAGRYADTRMRDLSARVSFDRQDRTLKVRRGAVQALYSSGGTIPDRGEFKLRHQNGSAMIGTLDEEFVWEAKVGDNFLLGTQSWQIQAITHNDVFVTPAGERGKAPPFWRGEELNRGYLLSRRIGEFLEAAEAQAQRRTLGSWLRHGFHLQEHAATQLERFLARQREHTRAPLPHRHHLLVEQVSRGPDGAPGHQVVLHTHWGGRVNRPYAMALEAAWTERHGTAPELFVGNDVVVLQLTEAIDSGELISLVRSDTAERHLRARLEGSGFFGARFREAAGRALLLPKRKFGERLPLWMNRLRSQRLLDAVHDYGDFPIVLEAWRSCLQDELDVASLLHVLGELEAGIITVGRTQTSSASPMAKSTAWAQVSEYMYRRDEPRGTDGQRKPALREDLIAEVAYTDELRPRVTSEACNALEAKLTRVAAGYAPRDADELLDWVKDRVVISRDEWAALLAAMPPIEPADALDRLETKVLVLTIPGVGDDDSPAALVVAHELVERVVAAWYGDRPGVVACWLNQTTPVALPAVEAPDPGDDLPITVLGQVLSFYGPLDPATIATRYALSPSRLTRWLDALEGSQAIITGALLRDDTRRLVCDARNFETLLRIRRAQATPHFEALESRWIAPFLASMQGLTATSARSVTTSTDPTEQLASVMDPLLALPLPCHAWETHIFPARVAGYRPDHLDRLLAESDLQFVGTADKLIQFSYSGELAVLPPPDPPAVDAPASPWRELFADPRAGYDLHALTHAAGRLASEVLPQLWRGVFAGEVTCDHFAPVRRAVETDFADDLGLPVTRPTRGRGRWRADRGQRVPGTWHRVERPAEATDPLDRQERDKERARLVLERYGIVFRQLLTRESEGFRWRDLFRSLRLMELSGEVLAGQFFHGIDGLQFISHQAFRHLVDAFPRDEVFWLNATDPASLCGVSLSGDAPTLPRRVPSTHLVYRGAELALISRRQGRELEFFVEPDDSRMAEYLVVFQHLLSRPSKPLARVEIGTIDGAPARHSPFVATLRAHFDVNAGPADVTLSPRR
ncbi:MAG: DEAD/DEAH box helicase [Myxococcales bacterium FL481]|nr:MAG: DEAD/DEAH box helicase [Myxococcales bacterium FL481]